MSDAMNILDRPIPRFRPEVNLSAYAFLFSEMVQYCHRRCTSYVDLNNKLIRLGERVGFRMLELLAFRDRGGKRETKLMAALTFIQNTLWKSLFGKAADYLERHGDEDNAYLVSDKDLLVNKFVSVPPEMADHVNCGNFVAGIVQGVLTNMCFPATVTAHEVEGKGTTMLVQFDLSKIPQEAQDGK